MLAILALGLLPMGEPTRQTIGEIELNHTYDGNGKLVFTQWIFREPNLDIRAWRLDKGWRVERDWERGDWVLRWWDGDVFREVRALSYRESHMQVDIEVFERNELPKEQRKGLLMEAQP